MKVKELAERFRAATLIRFQSGSITSGHAVNMEGHLRNYIARAPDWKMRESAAENPNGRFAKDFEGRLAELTLDRVRGVTVRRFRDQLLETGLGHKANLRSDVRNVPGAPYYSTG